ncbi:MAG: 50S ribosomal protein L5 [Phycisphaerae bacterium]|nr:50S ribosomal protein L5 [Phycisphaerae bacterium]MBM92773.1 50S ribosomal protein L5 [Phycisphaerae bacterium]HCT43746.1 50S ribosomal protein L5 [Phycisphaerales bacterium]|tara:strand:- start:160 stop:789 length:630 start_codon:yes stop_codon:yes gene_type:complete
MAKKAKFDQALIDEAQKPNTPRLKTKFDEEVMPKLVSEFGIKNRMAMPKLEKVTINVNVGRHLDGTKVPTNVREAVLHTLNTISGQKPVTIAAKKSVSNFKVREGYETAFKVTLRRDRMWHFVDRLFNLATPRIKDFRGLNDKAFDRQGSYSMGLTEQGVFPEINMAEQSFTHGMNINFSFSNSNPELSKFVLAELGLPFTKPAKNKKN